MIDYIVPILILFILIYGIIKNIPLFDTFSKGVSKAIPLVVSLFPYIVSVMLIINFADKSGLIDKLISINPQLFEKINISPDIIKMIIIRPFSGSGSIALLQNIIDKFGANSREAFLASIISSSSATIIYLSAIYFSAQGIKKYGKAVLISCISTLLGIFVAINIC